MALSPIPDSLLVRHGVRPSSRRGLTSQSPLPNSLLSNSLLLLIAFLRKNEYTELVCYVSTDAPDPIQKKIMHSNFEKQAQRSQVYAQLIQARRELYQQEQTLAKLNYEWNIAKRLRYQAHDQDEREQWRVQSDVHLGLVVQQEHVVRELAERVNFHQKILDEIDAA
jgi:hypothetical protein